MLENLLFTEDMKLDICAIICRSAPTRVLYVLYATCTTQCQNFTTVGLNHYNVINATHAKQTNNAEEVPKTWMTSATTFGHI